MGTWGARLTDDDFALDIIDEYFERFDKGEDPTEIRRILEETNIESINDPDEGHLFWLALAKAQWDIGNLDRDVLQKVLKIVESDIDTVVWLKLDGEKPEKRRQSLQAFALKIQTPREKPRKIKRQVLRSSPYEAGDVLAFKTSDGEFGVVVVGEAEKQTRFGFTGIAMLNLKQQSEPTLKQVISSHILLSIDPYTKSSQIQTCRYYAEHRKIMYEPFKVLGRLKVKKLKPPFDQYSSYGFWGNLIPHFEGGYKRKAVEKYPLKKYLGYLPLQEIKVL